MVSFFKNKLIMESCFNQTFASVKVGGTSMPKFKKNDEVVIGFVKDSNDEDEFRLNIESKSKNKSGEKDLVSIAVDDVDEIEHIPGTMQFYVHYQARVGDAENSSSIRGIFNKIKNTAAQKDKDEK